MPCSANYPDHCNCLHWPAVDVVVVDVVDAVVVVVVADVVVDVAVVVVVVVGQTVLEDLWSLRPCPGKRERSVFSPTDLNIAPSKVKCWMQPLRSPDLSSYFTKLCNNTIGVVCGALT